CGYHPGQPRHRRSLGLRRKPRRPLADLVRPDRRRAGVRVIRRSARPQRAPGRTPGAATRARLTCGWLRRRLAGDRVRGPAQRCSGPDCPITPRNRLASPLMKSRAPLAQRNNCGAWWTTPPAALGPALALLLAALVMCLGYGAHGGVGGHASPMTAMTSVSSGQAPAGG